MYGFFEDVKNIYLIMEVATGGQLFKQLKKNQSMSEHRVAGIMRQVCNAVNELHANRIIHRDIKPENIVLHDVHLFLCRILSSCAILGGQSTATLHSGLLSVELHSMLALKYSKEIIMMKKLISGHLGS